MRTRRTTYAPTVHLLPLVVRCSEGGRLCRPPSESGRYWTAYMIGYGKDPYAGQLKTGPTLVPASR